MEQIPDSNDVKERVYSPKEVSKILGVETDTLRKYADFFNIQSEWTNPSPKSKGHRRYTQKNIEELISIRDKIKNQGWSWDQALSWRNGEEEQYLKNHEEKSNLEKKIDLVLEKLSLQEDFNKVLIDSLNRSEISRQEDKKEIDELKKYIADSNKVTQQLLSENEQSKEEISKIKKRKGFMKWFGN